MTTRQTETIRVALEENINLYPEAWKKQLSCFEDYVETTYYDTEEGIDISYPEFLYNALEVISKIDANFNFALENEIRRFRNGQYEGAQEDRIEYEASDNEIYDVIYDEEQGVWVVEGYSDGMHWERDDFDQLFDAIDDLEMYLEQA